MQSVSYLIGIPLGYLMLLCMIITKNYGLAIIQFTLLTKIILFPLSIWVQKNSIKMIRMKPLLNNIEVRFIGNKNRAGEEQLKLYKQENYKPLLGVIPMLIQIPLVLGLISVIYNPLQHLLHLDSALITAFTQKAMEILNVSEMGSSAQINIIALITNPQYTPLFASLPINGAQEAVNSVLNLDMFFLGLNLSVVPTLSVVNPYLFIPCLSGLSAFLLSWSQNLVNVLQREASWFGRWGMALFLTAFSTYFAFLVPIGVGLYWICGNLFAILVMLAVNLIIPPKKFIDYPALEESKQSLAVAKEWEHTHKLTKEQIQRAKDDYKRFCDYKVRKEVVFYAEKSGFYKYFADVIKALLANSDITIHYVTSDANDPILQTTNTRIEPYFIDDNRLIVAFMKVNCDCMIMTTPDLQQFHLKRSLVRSDVEYIYMFHGLLSTNMVVRKGAYDYYDTVFCVGQHQIDELRESEVLYPEQKLKPKVLLPVGFGLIEQLISDYEQSEYDTPHTDKRILIAPSYQDDNIMDACIEQLIDLLTAEHYQVIVRPHPQYIRHNPSRIELLRKQYAEAELLGIVQFECNFATNTSIYASDLLITDWSGIAYEFSFSTKKPCLFINTPMKVLNPDYIRYTHQPLDITMRDRVGISLDIKDLHKLPAAVLELTDNPDKYRDVITELLNQCVFNLGSSGLVGAQYIISQVGKKRDERKNSLI